VGGAAEIVHVVVSPMRLVACANVVQVLVSEPLLLRERGHITWAPFLQCCVVKLVALLVGCVARLGAKCGVVWSGRSLRGSQLCSLREAQTHGTLL